MLRNVNAARHLRARRCHPIQSFPRDRYNSGSVIHRISYCTSILASRRASNMTIKPSALVLNGRGRSPMKTACTTCEPVQCILFSRTVDRGTSPHQLSCSKRTAACFALLWIGDMSTHQFPRLNASQNLDTCTSEIDLVSWHSFRVLWIFPFLFRHSHI